MSLYTGWRISGAGINPSDNGRIIALGSGTYDFFVPATLCQKLLPQNNTGLGSTSTQGNLLSTRGNALSVLFVVNTYLNDKLTDDELGIILNNRDKFEFAIGVGDRRTSLVSRFKIATNWHGEDVTQRVLTPDPFNDPLYRHTLTFSGETGLMTVTDSHAGTVNTYGGIRYFTVRKKE